MVKEISRKRAFDLAKYCIGKEMQRLAVDANLAKMDQNVSPAMKRRAEQYADLAAALDFIERVGMQKELF